MIFRVKIKRIFRSLVLAMAAVVLAMAIPGFSQTVQVSPSNPQLGDTLSVVIGPNVDRGRPPTVKMDGTTYPAFPIANGNRFRALLPTTPLDRAGARQIEAIGDNGSQKLTVQVSDRSFPTQSIWLPPDKEDLQRTPIEFELLEEFKARVTPEKYWNGPFLRPNEGPVSTGYGVRRYYNGEFAEDYYHRGVDYADYEGGAVVAPAAGIVGLVGIESQGFEINGNTIGIDHGQGVTSAFVHLSRIDVKEGDFVKAGQIIGGVGSTGISTGPHLHWGLYVHGISVDPVPWRFEGID